MSASNPDSFASLVDLHPADASALVMDDWTMTFGEVAEAAGRCRAALAAQGIGAGDHVGLVCGNDVEFVVGLLGITGLAAVAVPLSPLLPVAELVRMLDRAQCEWTICNSPAVSATSAPGLDPRGGLLGRGNEGWRDARHVCSWEELAATTTHPPAIVAPTDDMAAVGLFTSGTGGAPKMAMLSHANLLANQAQMIERDPEAIRFGDAALGVLPLSHVYGLNVSLGLSLRVGAQLVLTNEMDPVATMQLIGRHGVRVVAAAPPSWRAWSLAESIDALAGVRTARSGAAALDPAVAERIRERCGLVVAEGYGLTEAAPAVTAPAGDDVRPGSVGPPLAGVEVRLVDSDGRDALVGDVGEVWVRGPNVFLGYHGDPAATAAVVDPSGWLHTGDLAVADADGHLSLVDRLKDLIIVSGFNVFPGEVEEALESHPDIAAAVATGEPDDSSGERVVAHVQLADGATLTSASIDEMLEHCRARLARFKVPTRLLEVDQIVETPAGKVARRAFRSD